MSKQITFKVSKRGGPSAEATFDAPESVEDPRWAEVVSNPDEDINELAVQNLVIKMQSGARARLDMGEEAVQAYVNQYKYGARTGGFSAPKISSEKAEELGFSEEQLAALAAAGVKFGD